ncbi:MAG: 30S ribosomal protein S3ae [Candidatus Methylarchaceae archaeon HK02M2]|nr:30S ribosomal protein S3ae [Candidatus Methylarchaceae archaeon HK02M2]
MPKARKGRRVKDKWRGKQWIEVETPRIFGSVPIAYLPVTDPEKALGGVVETTLFDLVKQDPQQYTIKLYFQIVKVEDDRASTILKGQEYSRDYLRSLIRRGSSMAELINDYETIDEFKVRVYIMALTRSRINSSKKHDIREIAHKIFNEKVANMSYEQLAQEVIYGKIASDLYNEAKKITHMRHLGIRKMKLLSIGKPEAKVEQVTQVSSS